MLKVLVLQRFFDLSDEETEFQTMDRFSFLRFLGLRPGDGSPDHATIWSFKERLGADGMLAVFELFNAKLRELGLIASSGASANDDVDSKPRSPTSPTISTASRCFIAQHEPASIHQINH
ncbi:transposase [Cerasicoccus maritimus]|uniref:transposase n=1 Tax=Cerasicoccus maritimus TaxID=490089 RepID=UPI002852AD99|nr:transposase [Cerasicoccus maritimus]